MRGADDRRLGDLGHEAERGLDLERADLLAAAVDDLRGPADERQEAVLADAAEIARDEPATADHLARPRAVAPVLLHPARSGEQQAADLAGRQLRARRRRRFSARLRAPGGRPVPACSGEVVRVEQVADRGELREPVGVVEPELRPARGDVVDPRLGHGRAAVAGDPAGREDLVAALARREQAEDPGHAHQERRGPPQQRLARRGEAERGQQIDRPADQQHVGELVAEARVVEERHHHERAVALVGRHRLARRRRRPATRPSCVITAPFGRPVLPGGEADQRVGRGRDGRGDRAGGAARPDRLRGRCPDP